MQISLGQLTKQVESYLEDAKDIFIENLADKAISMSPVDTGAYVSSFSITPTSGAGRSRTSHGKPRNKSSQEMKTEAFANIQGDIANLGYGWTKAYLSNRAPHAWAVEERYNVMSSTRDVAGMLLEEAVNEVKVGQ